jgi:Arc-like DNA binding domain
MNRNKRKAKPAQPSPFGLRMPQDMKDYLEGKRERNGSSINSEIIRSVRDRMDAERRNGDRAGR